MITAQDRLTGKQRAPYKPNCILYVSHTILIENQSKSQTFLFHTKAQVFLVSSGSCLD